MKDNVKYAFLMIDYNTPDFIKDLHKDIKQEEIFDDDSNDYGLEKESHVTLVPCLDNETDLEKLKSYLKDLSEYKAVLTDISKFECEDYDVLKCNVVSQNLNETNKNILKDFESYSEYKDNYHPHLTVAYMKKGMADKYLRKTLDKYIVLNPQNFRFSWYEDNNRKTKKFDKIN